MILKRYGTTVHSVDTNFDSKALNEIGFRRNGTFSIPADELATSYRHAASHGLAPEAEGDVQGAVEQTLLERLAVGLRALESEAREGDLLIVENEQGVDYPKTRSQQKAIVVDGENRLYFLMRVEPPLRVGVYRKEG